jgi:hypothetical protein
MPVFASAVLLFPPFILCFALSIPPAHSAHGIGKMLSQPISRSSCGWKKRSSVLPGPPGRAPLSVAERPLEVTRRMRWGRRDRRTGLACHVFCRALIVASIRLTTRFGGNKTHDGDPGTVLLRSRMTDAQRISAGPRATRDCSLPLNRSDGPGRHC